MDYLNDSINAAMLGYEEKLEKAVNHVRNEFVNVRAGRVNPAVIERITVDYYGTPTPLKELATITNEDSRTLIVNPWDISIRPEVCKVIASANVGANPIDNGQYIRLIFPALTEDRRKELVKQVRIVMENAKVVMRNERRDAIDKIKRAGKEDKLGEDEIKGIEGDIQKILDNYIASVEKLCERKEAEIMEV